MPDSVPMIAEMVAYLDTLPKTNAGDAKVEDPSAVAVAFVGIAAPLYQADIDEITAERDTAQSLASQRNDELIGLRGEVDNLRAVLAEALGQLSSGDVSAALAALATV